MNISTTAAAEKTAATQPSETHTTTYLQVALPLPMHCLFDYKLPEPKTGLAAIPASLVGARVEVPFGKRTLVGVIMSQNPPTYAAEKVRLIRRIIDEQPCIDADFIKLANWCSQYYFFPIGETLATLLPPAFKKAQPLERFYNQLWQLTELGAVVEPSSLEKKSQVQVQVLSLLRSHGQVSSRLLQGLNIRNNTLESLNKQHLIEAVPPREQKSSNQPLKSTHAHWLAQVPPPLTDEQTAAVAAIQAQPSVHLLFGVTGSGKTEVYMSIILEALCQNRQVLVLVPEIGLTPQTLSRFNHRFKADIAVLHSQQTEGERTHHWLSAQSGTADLVIGTRSAIFTPMPRLGLIIVDEEHDQSYKQQDGMRYSARDLALLRAHWLGISVVLGSATPSLETLHNMQQKNLPVHYLRKRASGVTMPNLQLVDLGREETRDGLARSVLAAMQATLQAGRQVLVFLNRRGFAPAVVCNDCGWTADCPRCDARLTLHKQSNRLKCHHCDLQQAIHKSCPMCGSLHLNPHGKGTERVEDTLVEQFSQSIIRIDRDSMPNQKAFEKCLTRIHSGEPLILLGTQMLAKGHDFLGVHLVVILDIDGGLFSSDFRAEEKTGQLLTQVTGRAGRGTRAGQVMVQTFQPHHPVFQHWLHQDYSQTARYLLEQRQSSGLPPYSYHALLRSQAPKSEANKEFLLAAKDILLHTKQTDPQLQHAELAVYGPVNPAMERKAGVHRNNLVLQSSERVVLHRLLRLCFHTIEAIDGARRVRWHLELDPQEL